MTIPGTNAIIDLSHWNLVSDFRSIKDQGGIQAVILKASQGLSMDPAFKGRSGLLDSAGLLQGAYHFGVQSQDPVAQAKYFIRALGPKIARTAVALDWEWNKVDTMKPEQAQDFVQTIFDETGRWPLLYTSAAFLQQIMPAAIGHPLSECDLWLTGFTEIPKLPPQWPSWRIWQYGIGSCVGIQGECDRNTFNGTAEELTAYFNAQP